MIPNFDAMDTGELRDFYMRYKNGGHYLELFPRGGPETVKLTKHLAEYAGFKEAAIRHRLKGTIALAQKFEEQCEDIYQSLPIYVRW